MAQFVTTSSSTDVFTLKITGEVDIAAKDEMVAATETCLDSPSTTIEVDIGGVTFIDSSGLGALVRLRNEAGLRRKRVVVTNAPASVTRLFEVTGLVGVFETRTDG